MYKEILEGIKDVAIWPQISIGIFFIFFISLIVWTMRVNRDYIRKMKNLPMDEPGQDGSRVSNDAKIKQS